MHEPSPPKLSFRRHGIYFLPNLFTTASLFFGFYAIIESIAGVPALAAASVLIAMIFDGLDGRVARLINAQSAFGAEYDSLTDLVSFGMAPPIIIYNAFLVHLNAIHFGKLGWLAAFIYLACVALRLARFNSTVQSKRYFYGLPCPAAAALVASIVLVGAQYGWGGHIFELGMAAVLVLLGLLMVGSIPYRSFKDINLKGSVRFTMLILLVLIIGVAAVKPAHVLLILFAIYAVSGPYLAAFRYIRRWRLRK